MFQNLLWIAGIYTASVILIHVWYAFIGKHRHSVQHVVLVTGNHQLQIEWCIRYLRFLAWLHGREMHLTVLDKGSTDDTKDIVLRLNDGPRTGHLSFRTSGDEAEASISSGFYPEVTVYRLNRQDDLRKLGLAVHPR